MSSACESLSTTGTNDSAGSTSPSSSTGSVANQQMEQNQRKLDYLKGYFIQNRASLEQANHYYETISKREYYLHGEAQKQQQQEGEQFLSTYNEYFQMDAPHSVSNVSQPLQFDSMVLMPPQSSTSQQVQLISSLALNPTVVFLTHAQQEQLHLLQQQQNSQQPHLANIYGDISANNSSNQPLKSFLTASNA